MSVLRLVHTEVPWREFFLDAEGITQSETNGKQLLRWSDVSEVTVSIAQRSDREHDLFLSWKSLRSINTFHPKVTLAGGPLYFTLDPELAGLDRAVPVILEAVAPHLLARAQDRFAAEGAVQSGPLRLTSDYVQWEGRKLPRDQVESLELFEAHSVLFRVMRRRKILSWADADLSEIPNFDIVLRLAFELGYPVRRHSLYRELLAPSTTARALPER